MQPEESSTEKKTSKRAQKAPLEEQLSKQDNQPYDKAVKLMFIEDAAEMVPEVVEDAVFEYSENVELDQTLIRADVILRLRRRQEKLILDLEAQSTADPLMLYRVLQYLAALFKRYQQSIICLILYLFRCQVMELPPVINWGDRKTWEFKIICLWEEDPEPYVARRMLAFYAWLPAMNHPSVLLLFEALDHMSLAYDRYQIGYRLMWFRYFLRRSDTVSESDKQIVEEKIAMTLLYEEVIQEDDIIQKLLTQREFEGRLKGEHEAEARAQAAIQEAEARAQAAIQEAEARVKAETEARVKAEVQESIFDILSLRFSPSLATRAQPVVKAIQSYGALRQLRQQLRRAPNEQIASIILDLLSEPAKDGSSHERASDSSHGQSVQDSPDA